VDWGILRMAVLPVKEPLRVHAESVQTPHKFTWTLRLCSDKSEHLLVQTRTDVNLYMSKSDSVDCSVPI
jgi:hypothetical protein